MSRFLVTSIVVCGVFLLVALLFVSLQPADAQAISATLSGGLSPAEQVQVDDDLWVYVNGALVFVNNDFTATPISPIPLTVNSGDQIRIVASDTGGTCRRMRSLYLHTASIQTLEAVGVDLGCGFPAQTGPTENFYDQTFTVYAQTVSITTPSGTWYNDTFQVQYDAPSTTECVLFTRNGLGGTWVNRGLTPCGPNQTTVPIPVGTAASDWCTTPGANECGVRVRAKGGALPANFGSSAPLSAHWSFDEGSGGTVTDTVAGLVGTLQGGMNNSSWVPGKFGNALWFDGQLNTVQVPFDPAIQPTDEVTVSVWIKPDFIPTPSAPVGEDWGILAKGNAITTVNEAYSLTLGQGNGIRFRPCYDFSVACAERFFDSGIAPGVWTNIVATYKRNNYAALYFDGVFVGNWASLGTLIDEPLAQSPAGLTIGFGGGGVGPWAEHFQGSIDDIKIWKTGFSTDDEEIETFGIDFAAPTITSFTASDGIATADIATQPLIATTRNIELAWAATDAPGGSNGLGNQELWRAPYENGVCDENSKSGCAWDHVVSDSSTSATDNPRHGKWWYSVRSFDASLPNGNCITDTGAHCGGVTADGIARSPVGPLLVNVAVTGGLVPCGRDLDAIDTPTDETAPCGLCHGFSLVHNIIQFLLFPTSSNQGFAVVMLLGALLFAVGGFSFLVGALGNPALRNKGRRIIFTTVIALLIIYGSWLAIDFGLSFFGVTIWSGPGTWWQIQC